MLRRTPPYLHLLPACSFVACRPKDFQMEIMNRDCVSIWGVNVSHLIPETQRVRYK